MAKVATDFEKIIQEGRERKQNEALAARIFNRDRRSSAPAHKTSSPGGSLASRVGVKKRVSLGPRANAATKPANINGEWTHDLHNSSPKPVKPTSLAARITAPGGPSKQQQQPPRVQRRAAQVAQALIKSELDPSYAAQNVNVVPAASSSAGRGLTIRGLAGPFVVMAQNFAPGTTAADIESAMTPVGGIVSSCRLVKTQPIIIAEVVFESKEGADNVIRTFNNQTADGRLLHVYYKLGGPPPAHRPQVQPAPPTGPRASTKSGNGQVVDGSLGFDDPMETDAPSAGAKQAANALGSNGKPANGGLYSDRLVGSGNSNQRGRGFQRRGRGRGQ
ncbi:Pentatricopeptide repeat protein [Pleurostoma richardsiae]|uniref:Pentatricopeptide repeat protein n=1 Tax=Pleurostoma richardsiae TaxID=41990 RepID=A0AA38RW58_9PEZI|nr:Pentatricopeptide repeat protein [Pleurostoma richardsiae]